MQLEKLLEPKELLTEIQKDINEYFKHEMRYIPIENSIFEQYHIRPVEHIYIPNVFMYRVVKEKNKYYFGKLLR